MPAPSRRTGAALATVPLALLLTLSAEFCGPSVSSGFALGVGSVGRKEGEVWAVKLEELSNVCDGVVANFGKKLGVGEGFVARKSTGVCLNCKTLLLHL